MMKRTVPGMWLIGLLILTACGSKKKGGPGYGEPPSHPGMGAKAGRVGRIEVTARLVSYEPQHPWSETSSAGHDDGVSPRAGYEIISPSKYKTRRYAILFRHGGTPSPEGLKSLQGATFSMEIPIGFLESSATSLDNSQVTKVVVISMARAARTASKTGPPAKAPMVVESPPSITVADRTCARANDCVRASLWQKTKEGWCPQCNEEAVTPAAREKLKKWYEAHKAPKCPLYDCFQLPTKIVCEKGQCTIVMEEH